MWVTAYTDAGFKKGKGTWAIWLRSELGRVVECGKCPDFVDTSTSAELWAAWTAVLRARETWSSTRGVLVNSDCLTVVEALRPDACKEYNRDSFSSVRRLVFEFLELHEMRIRTKHVRGHGNGKNVRSYLNNQVDLLTVKAREKCGHSPRTER